MTSRRYGPSGDEPYVDELIRLDLEGEEAERTRMWLFEELRRTDLSAEARENVRKAVETLIDAVKARLDCEMEKVMREKRLSEYPRVD